MNEVLLAAAHTEVLTQTQAQLDLPGQEQPGGGRRVLDNAEQLGRRNQLRQALRALDKAMRHRCLHVMQWT
ncbi:MAG: hypothetical protein CVV17_12240 [Gammaproteobacteria bacterium HGW-Gammaproteobacteria-7]|nr:MAG: hypothetical protein CVV17_12240 [Gammaproteobacteria bacterium HGW-Gammaproteobacteria-7]